MKVKAIVVNLLRPSCSAELELGSVSSYMLGRRLSEYALILKWTNICGEIEHMKVDMDSPNVLDIDKAIRNAAKQYIGISA